METALELKNISYIFPDCKGITDISLQVKRGEIYMLYGCLLYTSDAADEL